MTSQNQQRTQSSNSVPGLILLGLAAGLGAPKLFRAARLAARKVGALPFSDNKMEAAAHPAVDPARGIAA